MPRHWTIEQRKRQGDLIRKWRPWEKSTGPKTAKGKAKVSQNAHRGGVRPMLRGLARILREQQKALNRCP